MKKILVALAAAALMLTGVACSSDADVASRNLSKAADDFQILRRVVFYNGISGDYILVVEGYCSLGNHDGPRELTVTCRAGSEYKKHFLGLSDNVTYFAEQIKGSSVSTDHYKVYFKPSTIVPDVDAR